MKEIKLWHAVLRRKTALSSNATRRRGNAGIEQEYKLIRVGEVA
jgi:hypothetical protein